MLQPWIVGDAHFVKAAMKNALLEAFGVNSMRDDIVDR